MVISMTKKLLTLIQVILSCLILVACDSSTPITQEATAEISQTEHLEVIVQEVTITDRIVPVVNASVLLENEIGAESPTSPGQNQPGSPPQDAIDACAELIVDDACTIKAPHGDIAGTCIEFQTTLACVPAGGVQGAPGRGP